MFTKMKNTMNKMSWKDWLVVSLWLLTFALLIAFVIVAATVDKGALKTHNISDHATVLAITDAEAVKHAFGTNAAHSELVIKGGSANPYADDSLFVKGWLAKGGDLDGKHLFDVVPSGSYIANLKVAGHTVSNDAANTYADAMSGVGFTFAAAIFGALGVTVWFKFIERKLGGNRG